MDVATDFGGHKKRFLVPSGATDFLSQKRPDQLGGPPKLLFQEQKVKVKVAFTLEQVTKAQRWSRDIALLFL